MAEAAPKMTVKQMNYLVYLAMKQEGESRFGQVIDRLIPLERLLGMLTCSMCGKWVRNSAAVCRKKHLTCGPHSKIVPRCTFETKGNVEFGPVGEFGEPCGQRFSRSSFKYIRVFYNVAKLLKETHGVVGTPTKEEEAKIHEMFLGLYDEYIEQLIEWGKSMEDQFID